MSLSPLFHLLPSHRRHHHHQCPPYICTSLCSRLMIRFGTAVSLQCFLSHCYIHTYNCYSLWLMVTFPMLFFLSTVMRMAALEPVDPLFVECTATRHKHGEGARTIISDLPLVELYFIGLYSLVCFCSYLYRSTGLLHRPPPISVGKIQSTKSERYHAHVCCGFPPHRYSIRCS